MEYHIDNEIPPIPSKGHRLPAKGNTSRQKKRDASKVVASVAPYTQIRTTRKPSEHLAELSLSVGERLALESQNKRPVEIIQVLDNVRTDFTVPLGKPLFQPYPTAIVLQNFTPFETYEVVLTFRNMDKFTRHLRIEPITSSFFKISRWESESLHSGRIASGMEVPFVIRFMPEERRDYAYDLVCATEREKFIVPLKAIGARGILDFPDVVNFPESAVRHTAKKTLLVRNVGNSPAKFVVHTDGPFKVIPSYGYLEINSNMQIDVAFSPEKVGSYTGEMRVQYESGEQVDIELLGLAEDADIRLERTCLRLDSTYITKTSMKSVRIMNRSDIMAHFQWKTFATDAEERQFRMRHSNDLEGEEDMEKGKLRNSDLADLCLVSRKFKNKRRNIERDKLLFDDDVFVLEPVEGNIYPNSYVDVTCIFKPQMAFPYNVTLFCEVSGRETRLPLQIKGEGVGPKARFSYDLLDIEDVFINSKHKYEVVMENQGDIAITYRLQPPKSLFGPKFQFSPSQGCLQIGEEQSIEINFASNILGEFSEDFLWELEGSPQPLVLGVRGHVKGPTFHFDQHELNFGTVSYLFSYSRSLLLSNSSRIPMVFQLRVPGDGEEVQREEGQREFRITPAKGCIPAGQSIKIEVEFSPLTIKKYDFSMVVDVESVGENVFRLPIYGESLVPTITLQTPLLDYGDCFLCNSYRKVVELANETDYPARYELRTQETTAKAVYAYGSDQSQGIIEPRTVKCLDVDIEIKRVGAVNFPIFIVIAGNEDIPLGVDISACGQGPSVVLSTNELNWGKINVLKEVPISLVAHNDSPIPASFTCSTVSETCMFKIHPSVGVIPPGGRTVLNVTAYLDDALKFTDILRIAVQSGGIHEVQLVARGQGSTITFDEGLQIVDFGNVFSNRVCTKEFAMVNNGRRSQTLHWLLHGQQGYVKTGELQQDTTGFFEVVPNRFAVKPGGTQIVSIRGFSVKAGTFKETLVCQGMIDKDPARRTVVEAQVTANFINPLVSVFPPSLEFVSAHTEDDDFEVLSQNLTLCNVSSLPLHLCLKCPPPYSILPSTLEQYLHPDEEVVIAVHFDPSYNTNRISCVYLGKISISYTEHPQRDSVQLSSKVNFPNLISSTNSVTFDCIPNNTEQRRTFTMTNTSDLTVKYSWHFLEDDRLVYQLSHPNPSEAIGQPGNEDVKGSHSEIDVRTAGYADIYKVFDMMPLHGCIEPGQTEDVEVTFYGHVDGLFSVVALCDVLGGPKYEIKLAGESSSIGYEFDSTSVDFGPQSYQDVVEKEISLTSTGKVAFDFQATIPVDSPLAKKIVISPAFGTILPYEQQKISIMFSPCIPSVVNDHFFIRISHFAPLKINIKGTGIFPRISMNIPHMPDDRYEGILAEARASMNKTSPAVSATKLAGTGETTESHNDLDRESEAEAEAERILLQEKTLSLLDELHQKGAAALQQVSQTTNGKSKIMGSPILMHYSQTRIGKDKKVSNFLAELSNVHVATYLCDLGNIVRNTTKKKVIRVTNKGEFPVSFSFDRSLLAGTGFSVEPERVKYLPGAPDHEAVEFTVSLVTRNIDLGINAVDLPLLITGGPKIIVALRAFVTVPELRVSTNDIQFSDVICGHRKTFVLQIQNANSVPCEWSTSIAAIEADQPAKGKNVKGKKDVALGRAAKDGSKGVASLKEFEIMPHSGTVQPGLSTNVLVRFSPTDEKNYDALITFKVNMNNKSIPVSLKGRGLKLAIQFEPETVTMGPILPFTDGTESKVSVYNPTDYPLEIYSLDFDEQHVQEEDILKRIDGYENGVIHLPPRGLGEPLPEQIVEMAMWKIQNEKAVANAGGLGVAESALGTTKGLPEGVGELHEPIAQRRNVGSALRRAAPIMQYPAHVILHGPPLSGKTTQSKKISALCGQTYVRVDDIVEAALANEGNAYGDLSAKIRDRLNEAQYTDKLHSRLQVMETSSVAGDKEDYVDQHLPEDLLMDLFRHRFQMADGTNGYIVDGLDSKYTQNMPSILKSLLRSFGDRRKIAFLHFTVEVPEMNARETIKQRRAEERENNIIEEVKDISDDAYESMTESQRESYDLALSRYKKNLKEIQRKRDELRRHLEEELAARHDERRHEEERHLKRRDRGRRPPPPPNKVIVDKQQDKSNQSNRSESTRASRSNILEPKSSSDRLAGGTKLKGERERGGDDDTSSRVELNDIGDSILSDSTYKQYEIYSQSLEAVLSIIKDGDKQPPKPLVAEKKTSKATRQANGAAAPNQLETHGNGEETEHTDDASNLNFHEINGGLEEESITKTILENVPPVETKKIAKDDTKLLIPAPYTEHIVPFPQDRDLPPVNRFFTLFSNLPIENEEISLISESTVGQSNVNLNMKELSRGDETKVRKGRSAIKVLEGTKPAQTEEPELEKEGDLKPYRWIVQPKERKELTVKFWSSEIGIFEQILSFEVVGIKGKYNLKCVGNCQYAQIVSDVRKIFPKCRKTKDDQSIVHGEYIISTQVFDFGPLLCTKPREKYQERFPENRVVLNIINSMQFDSKITFALRNDLKSEVFFFDPPSMDLPPGQNAELSVWAYPRTSSHFDDILVCLVKDNPEPYLFKLTCAGVRPELEIDKKTLSFDKLLINRTELRELKFKNSTLLPIAWKIIGMDGLGEEFKIDPADGMIEPFKEQVVTAKFNGAKPVVVKRMIRLEVSDAEKVSGVVQMENILVTAEAYDVSMEVHCPKGNEGFLDFGVLKVGEEGKQMCTLKNKGKYEVGYKFTLEPKEYAELFTILPQQGLVQPSDKPFPIQIVFKANRELSISAATGLKCVTLEPTTGEVISHINLKLIARAVFSKFSISPVRDLNFGALVYGTKATRQFVIENLGEFEFRYSLFKIIQGLDTKNSTGKQRGNVRALKGGKPPGVENEPTKPVNRKEMVKQADAANFGPFMVFPTSGVVNAGSKHQVTVEFHSEGPGTFEEVFALDISERSPFEMADAIEYRLFGENCIPGVNTVDFASIFEEQTVVKRLELFNNQSNVYAEEDRAFYFGAYLAGQQGQVRFKITNPYKVPCDVALTVKARAKSAKNDTGDVAFDVEPKKLSIPSHEHRYVTVSFHPTSMQSYTASFEATVENVDPRNNRSLSFELRGEGTLPRVSVDKPSAKSKSGVPFLKFKRLLLGATQTLPILLRNDGIIMAKVKLDWVSRDNEDFKCAASNTAFFIKPQESQTIEVHCRPSTIRKFDAELRLKVMDNSFEDTSIHLAGEGYQDDLTFDNLPNGAESEIAFGDCAIGETKQVTFTVSNHSNECVRLAWNDIPEFTVSPAIAHLQPKSTKETVITFTAKAASDIKQAAANCRTSKISYTGAAPEGDWDDRVVQVRWVQGDLQSAKPGPRKLTEHTPEPPHEVLGTHKDYHLVVTAFADYSVYECDTQAIAFKSTLMYQTRIFKFPLKNTGRVKLKYNFSFHEEESGNLVDNTDDFPFSVETPSGVVEPGETALISVRFSPIEVDSYTCALVCAMPNLQHGLKSLIIRVAGSSLRPFCHFELEDNDYISNERRNVELAVNNGMPAVLNPSTRVIEFGSCGVKVRNTKRFYIVNPTNISYEFEWICDIGYDERSPVFRCTTPKGVVMSGKKFEIAFEYTPEVIDLKESLWRFTIPSHKIVVPFLLVGQAMEPSVYMDRASINFKSLLVGRQVRETARLVNNENIPFSFSFGETSFELGNDGVPVLRCSPASGTVGPHSDIPIDITFRPSAEKVFNFNLVCNVRKKPTPVTINVKGEGYEIHETLQSEMNDGSAFDLVPAALNEVNILDFGHVQLNEKKAKRVNIINSGKFNFDFAWKFLSKSGGMVTIHPDIGTVSRGERLTCDISFMPLATTTLKNVKLACQITNGKSYPISVLGVGCKPLLKFSATSHDFGTVFLHRPGMAPTSHIIQIKNEDVRDISFDIQLANTNVFELPRGPHSLTPGTAMDVPILFVPRDVGKYHEVVKVEINGLSKVDIDLYGHGTDCRLELVHAEHRSVNFGAVRIGHTVVRQVKVINRSTIPATLSLGTSSQIDNLLGHNITMTPLNDFVLRSKGIVVVDFKFQPNHRIPPFSEEVTLEGPGILRPLLIVTGACQGVEVRLESDTLPFGAVVQKSSTTRRIQLQNVGDIGVKFRWDVGEFAPDFSISPSDGYISPGIEIPLEITFHPQELNQDIRYENLLCYTEGNPPLHLTLTGMCVPPQTLTEVVKFSTPVRQTDVKPVSLTNKTAVHWHIRPVVDNDAWSGAEVIDVEPGTTKQYDVSFTPLTMNTDVEGGRHEGSIFFPLPDGGGIQYKLSGWADKPAPVGTVVREIPCKTNHTELLAVTNWLKKSQRFSVITEVSKPDSSVILKGLDCIDVPGLQTREYKLNIYAYKEAVTAAKVIFKNDATGEFLFYNITFRSTPPGIIATLEMSAPVRQLSTKELTLSNPLNVPVAFTTSCNAPEISVPHSFILQPKSEGSCVMEYLPLLPKESMARLTLTSAELGLYQYDLKLGSTPPGPERSLHFKVPLGGNQTQSFRFMSFSKSKTEYFCKVENSDFSVDKSIAAPPAPAAGGGVEVSVEVMYEPSKLGDTRTQLVVSSPTGGDYICPLFGHCMAPRPQGPISVKPGATTTVPFKNVFGNSAAFNFSVDNPAFSIKSQETIPSKKTLQLVISYKQPTAGNPLLGDLDTRGSFPGIPQRLARRGSLSTVEKVEKNSTFAKEGGIHSKVGKLTVSHPSGVSWVYYLRGDLLHKG